jgi:hypothetical protein
MFSSETGYEHLTKRIIGCAVAVHNVFGAGLRECQEFRVWGGLTS